MAFSGVRGIRDTVAVDPGKAGPDGPRLPAKNRNLGRMTRGPSFSWYRRIRGLSSR